MADVIEIPIQSKVYGTRIARIDSEDMPLISEFKWYLRISGSGMYYATNRKTRMHMHWMVIGRPKDGLVIDHIDGDGLNNCKSNLRVVTHTQNMYNSRARKNTSSTFKGVHWNKSRRRWTCQIRAGLKTRHVGHFKSEIEAASAYNEIASILHGPYARLNNIKPLPASL